MRLNFVNWYDGHLVCLSKNEVIEIDGLFDRVEVLAALEVIAEPLMIEETSNQRELLLSLTEKKNDFSEMMIITVSSILNEITDRLLPLQIFQ